MRWRVMMGMLGLAGLAACGGTERLPVDVWVVGDAPALRVWYTGEGQYRDVSRLRIRVESPEASRQVAVTEVSPGSGRSASVTFEPGVAQVDVALVDSLGSALASTTVILSAQDGFDYAVSVVAGTSTAGASTSCKTSTQLRVPITTVPGVAPRDTMLVFVGARARNDNQIC